MIYTVTLNPAVDYTLTAENFSAGRINRAHGETFSPGGKGINVSRVLMELGAPSLALGFAAGRTGDMLCELADTAGISRDFIRIDDGMTRVNVKIKSDTETEINGAGPNITMDDINALKNRLEAMNDGDTLVLAGSAPRGIPDTVYADILRGLRDKHINAIVDAEGSLLTSCLEYIPFLIKPNINELAQIFGRMPEGEDEIREMARELVERGAKNVLVSMGGDGAVFVNKDRCIIRKAPEGNAVDTTGSGDSMVAGFIAGYGDTGDFEEAVKMAVAAGSAGAFRAGLPKRDDIMKMYDAI